MDEWINLQDAYFYIPISVLFNNADEITLTYNNINLNFEIPELEPNEVDWYIIYKHLKIINKYEKFVSDNRPYIHINCNTVIECTYTNRFNRSRNPFHRLNKEKFIQLQNEYKDIEIDYRHRNSDIDKLINKFNIPKEDKKGNIYHYNTLYDQLYKFLNDKLKLNEFLNLELNEYIFHPNRIFKKIELYGYKYLELI